MQHKARVDPIGGADRKRRGHTVARMIPQYVIGERFAERIVFDPVESARFRESEGRRIRNEIRLD